MNQRSTGWMPRTFMAWVQDHFPCSGRVWQSRYGYTVLYSCVPLSSIYFYTSSSYAYESSEGPFMPLLLLLLLLRLLLLSLLLCFLLLLFFWLVEPTTCLLSENHYELPFDRLRTFNHPPTNNPPTTLLGNALYTAVWAGRDAVQIRVRRYILGEHG